jgi:hypothetical protein
VSFDTFFILDKNLFSYVFDDGFKCVILVQTVKKYLLHLILQVRSFKMNDLLAHIPNGHPFIAVIFLIIGIFLVRSLFRFTFKLAFLAAMVGIILFGILGYSPKDVFNKGKQIATYTTSYVEDTIKPAIYNGIKNAHVEKGPNGRVEFIGDHFKIGQTPQGKFVFQVNSLNVTISQDELAKFLSKDEMQKLLQTLQDKKQPNEL